MTERGAGRPAHGAGEHGTFDAVNVTEQPRFSRRLLRAAAVSCAGIALAFVRLPRQPSAHRTPARPRHNSAAPCLLAERL